MRLASDCESGAIRVSVCDISDSFHFGSQTSDTLLLDTNLIWICLWTFKLI